VPAVVDAVPGQQGGGHLLGGDAGGTILGRVEAIGRLAAHHAGFPTEDLRGPGVPVGDDTVAVHRDDGVVDGAAEHRLVAVLAGPGAAPSLGLLDLGQTGHDRSGEQADDLAVARREGSGSARLHLEDADALAPAEQGHDRTGT
jgi:hypothetical protein